MRDEGIVIGEEADEVELEVERGLSVLVDVTIDVGGQESNDDDDDDDDDDD